MDFDQMKEGGEQVDELSISLEKDANGEEPKSARMNAWAPCVEMYDEDMNILVASWINDLYYPQKDFMDKVLFYNSESLLNDQNLLGHFLRSNKKLLEERDI